MADRAVQGVAVAVPRRGWASLGGRRHERVARRRARFCWLRDDVGVALTRFWFEFDLDGHRPPGSDPLTEDVDGRQQGWLAVGAGVTGYDEEDALTLLRDRLGADLPPRVRTAKEGDADRAPLG